MELSREPRSTVLVCSFILVREDNTHHPHLPHPFPARVPPTCTRDKERKITPMPLREETQGQGCLAPESRKPRSQTTGNIQGCKSAPGTVAGPGPVRHQRARWVSECSTGRQRCCEWASCAARVSIQVSDWEPE